MNKSACAPPHVPNACLGSTVQVVSINPRMAKTKILCVGAVPLQQTFSGIIRFVCVVVCCCVLLCVVVLCS